LLVDGGGMYGGSGAYFANAGPDFHVFGRLAPLVPGCLGVVVIRPMAVVVSPTLSRDGRPGIRLRPRWIAWLLSVVRRSRFGPNP
jgi:hypothetical protein